jgi:hypothetical protein
MHTDIVTAASLQTSTKGRPTETIVWTAQLGTSVLMVLAPNRSRRLLQDPSALSRFFALDLLLRRSFAVYYVLQTIPLF